jgi:hypothetical protein
MNFSDLQSALAIKNGQVTIAQGLLTPNIDAMLGSCYLGQSIVISGAKPGPGSGANGTVLIQGLSSFLNILDLPVVASFLIDQDGNAQAMIKYTLLDDLPGPNDWRFSKSFPNMPQVVDWNQTYENPLTLPLDGLSLFNSFYVVVSGDRQEPVFNVALKTGINFVGNLHPTGILGMVESLFGGTAPLKLIGTIVIPGPTATTFPMAPLQFPWTVTGIVPGILLQADLGLSTSFGKMTFGETALRIYSPTSTTWLDANPSWQPVLAYLGKLAIPSASLSVDLTAPIAIGADDLLLFGHFEGFTLGNLASLADFSGPDNLIAQMPDQIKSAGDALGKLELTQASIEVTLDLSTRRFGVSYVSATVGMPALNWSVWQDHFKVDSILTRFAVSSPFDSKQRSVEVSLFGSIEIEGVPVNVIASNRDSFTVYAEMADKQTIPLKRLMSEYVPGVPAPSDLTIDTLRVSVAPFKSYAMALAVAQQPEPWKISLGPKDLQISDVVLAFAYPTGGPVAGSFGGTIAIDGIGSMSMRYDIPGNIVMRAALPNVSLMQVVRGLTNQSLALPGGFDIDFEHTSVLIQKTGDNYLFQLGTEVQNVGILALQIQRVGAQWGYAAGLQMNPHALLTKISGLGGVGDLLELFMLDELLLVVASFADPRFTFPDLAAFNDPSIRAGSLKLPAQSSQLVAGLNVFAQWNFDSSQQQQFLKKFLGVDSASLGIVLQIGENPSQNAKLFAKVNAKVDGLSLAAQFGGLIRNGEPGFFLMGTLIAPIQGHDYQFTVDLLFVANGAYLSGTMMGATTIDLGPFKLGNVALAVGIDWEGIPSLGIAGTIDIETFESSLAVFFNANQPAQSLVAGSVSDLTLKNILDTLTGNAIPSEIDGLLDQFGIFGTNEFEVPASLGDDLDNLRIDKVSAAFAASHVTIPAVSTQVLLVVNTRGSLWYLTDMTDEMKHYRLKKDGATIKVSVEPQFYLAPEATFIGEIPFQQGFRINGAMKVLDIKASASIDVSTNKGIAVDAQMDKIVIGSETLFAIAAAQGDGGPRVSVATYQRDSDPVAEFRPPHFYINGGMTMLGLQRHIFASLSKSGFAFDLNGDLIAGVNFDTHCTINSLTDLDVGGSLKIAIGKIDLGPLGSISINTGVAGLLDLSVKGSQIKADVEASFVFAGTTYNLVTLHLDVNAKSLLNLPGMAWEKVKEFLKDLLLDATKWAKAVADGFIDGVKDVEKVLVDFFGKTKEEAKAIWDGLKTVCAATQALFAM